LVESYDFRLALEPAAILSPGFRLDPVRASAARLNMEALLSQSDASLDVRAYARVDEEFHELIAAGTPNRFIGCALTAHHRLRRLAESLSSAGAHRLRQSLRDHLAILAQLEARQNETAADLLRAHLRSWRNQRPHAANRGAPPLAAAIRRPG
jgi:DNA-binding GntR family transcriptional regulator